MNLFRNLFHSRGGLNHSYFQYMSVIFYFDNEQRKLAEESLKNEQRLKRASIETKIVPAKEFYPAEDYHQKYLLQRHPFLCNALDIATGEEFMNSHVAARINGYIGGYGTVPAFDKEWSHWGITEKMAEYIRKQLIFKASH
ncbi:Peptide methionine sulfoxide reductase [Armadillidium vulgare]|nr:Peptide methionine sulfoxide reductase [Armadillidium vulgare]